MDVSAGKARWLKPVAFTSKPGRTKPICHPLPREIPERLSVNCIPTAIMPVRIARPKQMLNILDRIKESMVQNLR
jgi:hypothetical protein